MLQSQVPHWEASASREHRGECMSSRRSFTQTVKHGPPYLNPMLTAQVQQFSVHYYLTAIEELSMVIGGPESFNSFSRDSIRARRERTSLESVRLTERLTGPSPTLSANRDKAETKGERSDRDDIRDLAILVIQQPAPSADHK